MPTISELLDANLHRVFGERDAARRRAAIDEVYAEDVVFSDPEGSVTGRDALAAKAEALLSGAPDAFVFRADGPAYAGTDSGALAWTLGPEGAPVARGIDVITVRDGRIAELRTMLADEAS
ncbi:nuclear transport factor 2 family protein [Leifsonia sp. NPDC080035]|uniref:Nuclear transport factor 2 family protein n=1 Tax=Leifsonia sp. NPDC080035 TaxID=3143936 RepID=A0AAU7GCK7_9MICO